MSSHADTTITKVLIANRGEIALRIMRTLREMGIASVAVHSEADRGADHVRYADEAVEIGPPPARESYLVADRIIAAARARGAQAIHPGYGFLAENADFAQRCEEAGLIFVGPSAESIRRMGDKAAARTIAEEAGVPVVPGRAGVAREDELLAAADALGFPLLLKPAAGGGGKGMKAVSDRAELVPAAQAARRVAEAAFGDGTLILEKLVRPARHVEIQVFGDRHGHAVALGERECSLQRRHQKVIEECPSPVVGQALRERMSRAAVSLARTVGYHGAGTVEFLLGEDDSFYFLEMNTRLQVEHPVTEMVYGVDLVRAQIAVAAGEPLPRGLVEAAPRGHAIEARLYAEDPDAGFLPTPGRVLHVGLPRGPGVRFDGALEGPGEVSPEYDPMIAKVVAWGTDRAEAQARLDRALRETIVLGVTTNGAFLLAMLRQPWFASAAFHTRTIEDLLERDGRIGGAAPELPPEVLAAAVLAFGRRRGGGGADGGGAVDADVFSPFVSEGAWRGLTGGAG